MLLLFVVSLTSCGTTHIIALNSNADIYINNQYKGKGFTTVKRIGPPQKLHIESKYQGAQVGYLDIHREFTPATLIIGIYTYGIGLFLTWSYPQTIIVPCDIKTGSEFDKYQQSIWDLPPGNWKRK